MEKLSKMKKIALGVVSVFVVFLFVTVSCQQGKVTELESSVQSKSDSIMLQKVFIQELQKLSQEQKKKNDECEKSTIQLQQENSKWKLKYYEQKAQQTDCESLVDHAVLNSTPPDLQGLLLANRLISGKTGGFRLVVPQQPDKPDE